MKAWVLVAMVAALAGCSSPCVQLASKICDCQDNEYDRDNCNSNVSASASEVNITSADNAACSKLVDKCECHELNTPQGKKNCGLAE